MAFGSGAALLAAAASRHGIRIEAGLLDLQPSAAALAALAAGSAERVAVLSPLYLRPPDARPQGHDARR
jgi:tRNA A37 threonylcarbamoyladenosine modification protein TsaB